MHTKLAREAILALADGRVFRGRAFGALGNGMYQVDDGTGKIWVLSEGFGVPSKGAKVSVTGNIVQAASFAGVNYSTVLRETQKRH